MTGHDATDPRHVLRRDGTRGEGNAGSLGEKGTGKEGEGNRGRKGEETIVPSQWSRLRGHGQEGTKVSPGAPHPAPGLCFQQQPPRTAQTCKFVHGPTDST